ncbi:MAG: serpin family protein, partial [Candidatus Zixiibacteriota bacterium]
MNHQCVSIAIAALFVCGTGGQAQCGDQSGGVIDSETESESRPAGHSALVESINRFGFKLFREIAASAPVDSNVFVSPVSAAIMLSAAYNGASGSTQEEIADCLELSDLSLERMNRSWRELIDLFTSKDSLVEVGLSNSLWIRAGKTIEPGFSESLSDYYCQKEEVDFRLQSATDSINEWANRATGGRISSIVEESFPPNTAAVLLNATYFKGFWKRPFDSARTRKSTFHLASGREADCQMMWLTREDYIIMSRGRAVSFDSQVTYYYSMFRQAPDEGMGFQKTAGVTLPYGNGSFRTTILVPLRDYFDSSATIDTLMNQFTWETWRSTLPLFNQGEFALGLPKFRISVGHDLEEVLQTLGIRGAFDPERADFSNMFADGRGWIDRVRQKVFVKVDEKGTEAAAITKMLWGESIPPTIVADRPFL